MTLDVVVSDGSASEAEGSGDGLAASNGNNNPGSSGLTLENLGVSVFHLKDIFLDSKVCGGDNNSTGELLSRNSTIHEIENLHGSPGVIRESSGRTTSPVDGRLGAAYVHCLRGANHVGEATHMLSYSWSYTIGDVVDSLCDFCQSHKLDPKRTYIWIDCLCINQHRVVEQKENGGTGMLNFETEFPALLVRIGTMLSLMAPWQAPAYLSRVWCIFEIYSAHTNGCKVEIIMPPREKESLEHNVVERGRGIDKLYQALANTRVQNAQASVESDRTAILGIIQASVSFYHMNCQVNELLRGWVRQTLGDLLVRKEQEDGSDTSLLQRAKILNGISEFLRQNGEQDVALEVAQKSLQTLQQINPENVDASQAEANAQNSIGLILHDNAQYDDALQAHQEALFIQKKSLVEDDESMANRAETYFFMGKTLHARGDCDDALRELEKALVIRQSHLGANHVDTGATYSGIGAVLHTKGDYGGALKQYQLALAIQREALGEHPDTATTCRKIGDIHNVNCDYDLAISLYQTALDIHLRVLGKAHADTADTYRELGLVLYYKGDLEGALQHQMVALEIQQGVLGEGHPAMAITYNNIGTVLQEQGDMDGAMVQFEKTRLIQETVLGRVHPDLAPTHNNIGLIHYANSQYDLALDEFRTALEIKESVIGKGHSDTARELNRIGNCFRSLGQPEKALLEYRAALAVLTEEHAFMDMVQENIEMVQQEISTGAGSRA